MEKYFSVLCECKLFQSIDRENLVSMLQCLKVQVEEYRQGETIWEEGESAKNIGIVLSGNVQIIRIDYFGNRSILTNIEPAQLFGESFACADMDALPVHVIAASDSAVMFLNANRMINTCGHACAFHRQVIFNLLKVVATKNLLLNQKMEITSKRSTREKLMTYLLGQAKRNNSNAFDIPFNRQELADYLEVERSGLSAEISKLRKEKVLECQKNRFVLL